MKTRVAIIGQFDSSRPSRALIGPALEHSAAALEIKLHNRWVPTEETNASLIEQTDAIFISPGAPDEDIAGSLDVIQAARLNRIPCLGTCGGFQRVVTEYVLNELGFAKVEHEELSPGAVDPFFSQLSCSLVGKEAEVQLSPDSLASKIYGSNRAIESFSCGYGINGKFHGSLQSGRLTISGYDPAGEARIVELTEHPFFMATLFVPQVRSSVSHPHPIITAFLESTIR